jgi:hypothetical protein
MKTIEQSDRGVSTTLGYALTLGISTLLITGLVIAGGTYIENQREQAIRTELNVLGQQVASDVQAADRLSVASDGSGIISVRRSLPDRVAGSTYTLTVVDADSTDDSDPTTASDVDPYLRLRSGDPEVTVTVDLAIIGDTWPDTPEPVQGGRLVVRSVDTNSDGNTDKLVVENA